LLEIRDVLVHRRRPWVDPKLQPGDTLDENPEVLRQVKIAVDRNALEKIVVVVRIGGDAEAGVGEVLEPLTEFASEAQVGLRIVGVERNVLDGVERIGPIPRVREVRVVFVEAQQRIGRGIPIG
jgi:hypothetical protein